MEIIEWQDIALELKEKLNTALHYDRAVSKETKQAITKEILESSRTG